MKHFESEISSTYITSSSLQIGQYVYKCVQTNYTNSFTTIFNYIVQPNQPYIQEIDISNAQVKYGTSANILVKIMSNTYYNLGNYEYKYELYQKKPFLTKDKKWKEKGNGKIRTATLWPFVSICISYWLYPSG